MKVAVVQMSRGAAAATLLVPFAVTPAPLARSNGAPDFGLAVGARAAAPAPPVIKSFMPRLVYVHQPVLVLGANFIGTKRVSIGRRPAGFDVVTDEWPRLVVPVRAVSARIVIANPAGKTRSGRVLIVLPGKAPPPPPPPPRTTPFPPASVPLPCPRASRKRERGSRCAGLRRPTRSGAGS